MLASKLKQRPNFWCWDWDHDPNFGRESRDHSALKSLISHTWTEINLSVALQLSFAHNEYVVQKAVSKVIHQVIAPIWHHDIYSRWFAEGWHETGYGVWCWYDEGRLSELFCYCVVYSSGAQSYPYWLAQFLILCVLQNRCWSETMLWLSSC